MLLDKVHQVRTHLSFFFSYVEILCLTCILIMIYYIDVLVLVYKFEWTPWTTDWIIIQKHIKCIYWTNFCKKEKKSWAHQQLIRTISMLNLYDVLSNVTFKRSRYLLFRSRCIFFVRKQAGKCNVPSIIIRGQNNCAFCDVIVALTLSSY